jgi:alpha-methylacyl-CoA racemase
MTEAADHPHIAARGTLVEHHGVLQPAPAPRFGRTAPRLGSPPASAPGAQTREALLAWGVDDVDRLLAEGIARQADI